MTSMTTLTKEQRMLKSRAGGLTAYAKHGASSRSEKARRTRMAKYEEQVLEAAGGDLAEDELAKRAYALLQADMAKLSLASSISRGKRKHEKTQAEAPGEPVMRTVVVELPPAICPVCVMLSGERVGRDALTSMCETHLLEFYGYVLAKSEARAAAREAELAAAGYGPALKRARSGGRRRAG